MKQSFGKNPELLRITNYFKKIEAIADRLGVDVDDLVEENRNKKSSMYTSFKDIIAVAQNRIETLSNHRNGSSPLTLIFNDGSDN